MTHSPDPLRPQAFHRPARLPADSRPATIAPINVAAYRATLVDLNNFATFPTLAVGLLVAALRNAGFDALLISPLAHDVPAAEREHREGLIDHLARRLHLSTWTPLRIGRNCARALRAWWLGRPHPRVIREVRRTLERRPNVILLSAYLQHYRTVVEVGKLAQRRGIPLVLGGPVFNMPVVANEWRLIPGLTAIVGGEVDIVLPDLIRVAIEGGDLLAFEGVTLPDGRRSAPARPLRDLDRTPTPDFTDFPWDRYRLRVIPVMTGRGCQWARCTFCSDVQSASGRTFRTRSVESVLSEMEEQARRHQTQNFLFLDIKLNSNPAMLRGITEHVQRLLPGAQWIGTVHVDRRQDNGLSRQELRAMVAAGMRRVSFGLESGSQRMLDLMDKGCTVEANAEFIRHAHAAGLSVRCTMFKGFPGETAEDLAATARFLEAHGRFIDRIRFNDFSIHEMTPVYQEVLKKDSKFPQIRISEVDARNGRLRYANADGSSASYRKAKAEVLAAVHQINRRPIRPSARVFDGLM
jgi:radical SAM superfamily enzyme YgiQ (UPF0313 family)